MDSVEDLAKVLGAISKVSQREDIQVDNWVTTWCNTNWGDLLQPATLSISLLSSLMVIGSSMQDLSLVGATRDFKSMSVKYMRSPTSFKATLQQLASEGHIAFLTVSQQMTRIQNASSQFPREIQQAFDIVLKDHTPEEIETLLPIELETISQLIEICKNASHESGDALLRISALVQEIQECAIFEFGTPEQQKKQNEMHEDILKMQKEQEALMVKEAEETSKLLITSIKDVEGDLKDAAYNLPIAWKIMAMNMVKNSSNAITGPINALLGIATMENHYLQTGKSTTERPGKLYVNGSETLVEQTTLPSGAVLSDPGVTLPHRILGLVIGIRLLISGGADGKPDWDNIRVSQEQRGSLYLEKLLERMKGRLNKAKPISNELLGIVDEAIKVIRNINTPDGIDDTVFDKYKQAVENMIKKLQGIVTRCNLILQQTGNSVAGPGNPSAPISLEKNPILVQSAVEDAKFQVDQTRANLEVAREAYDRANVHLIQGQREITKTIGELTQLKLETITLDQIIPVLKKAVKAFTTLRAQFSQLMRFFVGLESLVNQVIQPQAASWANKAGELSRLKLAEVKLSDVYANAMLTQLMGLLKVGTLAERISATYLRASDRYIIPAVREVGQLLRFQEDTSEEGRTRFLAELTLSQKAIQNRAQTALDGIAQLVDGEQMKLAILIKSRTDMIKGIVGEVLPEVRDPLPEPITYAAATYVAEFDKKKVEMMHAIPVYLPESNVGSCGKSQK